MALDGRLCPRLALLLMPGLASYWRPRQHPRIRVTAAAQPHLRLQRPCQGPPAAQVLVLGVVVAAGVLAQRLQAHHTLLVALVTRHGRRVPSHRRARAPWLAMPVSAVPLARWRPLRVSGVQTRRQGQPMLPLAASAAAVVVVVRRWRRGWQLLQLCCRIGWTPPPQQQSTRPRSLRQPPQHPRSPRSLIALAMESACLHLVLLLLLLLAQRRMQLQPLLLHLLLLLLLQGPLVRMAPFLALQQRLC